MTSATSAVEAAVYSALSSDVTLATVYQHAPENAALPVVVIGDIEIESLELKEDVDGFVSLSISTITQGEERKPALAIMEQVKTSLSNKTFASGGWTVKTTRISESCVLLPDGITYVGTSNVTLFVTN